MIIKHDYIPGFIFGSVASLGSVAINKNTKNTAIVIPIWPSISGNKYLCLTQTNFALYIHVK